MLPDAVENIDEDQKQGDEHGHPENEVSDVVSNGIYGDGVHNIELSAAEATHPQFPVVWEIQPSQNKYLCFFVLLCSISEKRIHKYTTNLDYDAIW